ncbi:MAG: TonB-dependent receptor [Haliea sp.]
MTATREARRRLELPESIGVLDQSTIEQVAPGHPAELLNRLAGVHVNNLGGEGHMTAIRQPLTTGGVYLFLEDGIPTRPTGFFNHNGLYEIDLAQAQRIEVTRGPGSALYGSDAIGGLINSITRSPGDSRELTGTLEAGEDNRYRGLLSLSGPLGRRDRAGLQLNLTDKQSFREATDYRRTSLTARWDREWSPTLTTRTVLAGSRIEESGASPLETNDYRQRPASNYFHGNIGFREVATWRLSSELNWEPSEHQLWSLTGFLRDNSMDLMPAWMLSYDPNQYLVAFTTAGLMARYRHRFSEFDLEWISGVDVDFTPSTYREQRLLLERRGPLILDARPSGRTNYDYAADQLSVSPYTQLEWTPHRKLRLSAGLRHDHFAIDYRDRLPNDVSEIGVFEPLPFPARHYRPDSQNVSFEQWSPKLGLVWDISADHNFYLSHRHAFRAPTAGQLFRGGAVADTTHLQPVKAVSNELGLRGHLGNRVDYDLAFYQMIVEDDIVSLIADNTRQTVNSGETRHQGIELTLHAQLTEQWSATLAWSHSQQEYRDFTAVCGARTCSFAGNDLPRAPEDAGNASLAYSASDNRWRIELEWEYLGRYFTDETNSLRYTGHQLLNLRGQLELTPQIEVYARLQNLADRRYATYVSNQVGSPDLEYRPGQPRSATLGVRFRY